MRHTRFALDINGHHTVFSFIPGAFAPDGMVMIHQSTNTNGDIDDHEGEVHEFLLIGSVVLDIEKKMIYFTDIHFDYYDYVTNTHIMGKRKALKRHRGHVAVLDNLVHQMFGNGWRYCLKYNDYHRKRIIKRHMRDICKFYAGCVSRNMMNRILLDQLPWLEYDVNKMCIENSDLDYIERFTEDLAHLV